MDITTITIKIKIECTDNSGLLQKNKFKVALVFKLIELVNKGIINEKNINELNKQISKILGRGHSLKSCVQFFSGKKAIPHIQSFCNENFLTAVDKDLFLEKVATFLTFH